MLQSSTALHQWDQDNPKFDMVLINLPQTHVKREQGSAAQAALLPLQKDKKKKKDL